MSRKQKDTFGLAIMLVVIAVAFFFITPFFNFSCSRVLVQDFLGMGSGDVPRGLFFSDRGIAHLVPLLVMFVLWSALALWVYHDAERRGHSGLLWGLFAFIGNIIGLIIYLIVRSTGPAYPVGAAGKCPGCGGSIQTDYVACPHCGTNLSKSCGQCGKRAELDWKVCPYCGHAMDGQ